MNVTSKDIRGIGPGCAETFQCESPEKLFSAKSLVGYCNKIKHPAGVWKYVSKSDINKLTITITAISIDGIKKTNNDEKAI